MQLMHNLQIQVGELYRLKNRRWGNAVPPRSPLLWPLNRNTVTLWKYLLSIAWLADCHTL